ncbi:zinc-ribbon domain-containing protein [uncultured Leifsonia sp.]|uniref:zinc ribbon domain-containing protein n=1 Tax=uncultured Leifsonia sp. TaxID=340359 RepID=UPI0028D38294|nr:zinc-ribbon domain-containing protein [uncultured Leifsonia sp.]
MTCRVCGAELAEGTLFCGKCGSSVTASRVRPPEVADPRPSDTSIVERLPKPAIAGRFPADELDEDGLPATQAMPVVPIETAAPLPRRSYTLSFSTGETVEVLGSGLVGRRPITQPGEHVDQLVVVSDPARSVSKTHLEFGLEGDDLWICDRYSGNGTVARPLGDVARQCEAGRRYRVTRGTRVEIGDQWFDVS